MNIYEMMSNFLEAEFQKETDFFRSVCLYNAISAINELKKNSGSADSDKEKIKIGDFRNEQMDKTR